jgi:disulfide bond formation protein DsbB
VLKPAQVWTALAGLAILTSGAIGGFHAGVEYGWWEGITGCSTLPSGIDVMDPAAAPLIRCDVAPWTLWGISIAGFNFLISGAAGAAILALAAYRK